MALTYLYQAGPLNWIELAQKTNKIATLLSTSFEKWKPRLNQKKNTKKYIKHVLSLSIYLYFQYTVYSLILAYF